jgi:hypothetical protein
MILFQTRHIIKWGGNSKIRESSKGCSALLLIPLSIFGPAGSSEPWPMSQLYEMKGRLNKTLKGIFGNFSKSRRSHFHDRKFLNMTTWRISK